ncbi:MAG: hypothetical protein N3B16_05130 [Candidatus Aminicenantes bacterium]|nr:hypothetical protein [Candidatus Aminicenantes bacterium]
MKRKGTASFKNLWLLIFGLNFILIRPSVVFGQSPSEIEELKKQAPKVYLDCSYCDLDYIRTEITFVNYVRDRKEAQIYILVTTQRTGGGGREYTLTFMGEKEFANINHIQKYFSSQTDTQDEIRQGLVQALKVGLMPFLARTPLRRYLAINYLPELKPQEIKDKWNYWVFNLRGSGYFRGESNYHSESISLNFSANRVTQASKIRLSFSWGENTSTFKYDNFKIVSKSESGNFSGLYVKSLGEHWSAGFFLNASSSTYENIKFSINPGPAVEYNFFPYSQSSRRQLRCLYRLYFTRLKYREETIYDKLNESLWGQAISLTLDVKEKWGTTSVSLSGSHYFHDWRKNRLTAYGVVNLFLFKGLSFYVFGGGSRIRDQLSLAKRGASLEEVLLLRRQLETSYSYFVSIGLSYTFGSVFANVVNPRFDTRDGRGIRIEIYER